MKNNANDPALAAPEELHNVLLKSISRVDRDFFRIPSVSTALGLGFMAAAIQSLRGNGAGFYFSFSPWTLLACVLGAGLGLLCWKLIDQGRWAARTAFALLILAGAGGFLYPLRFADPEKLPEIAKGLTLAVCVLSVGATLLWQVKRFLEHDAAAH